MALPTGGYARATVMPDPGLVDPRLLVTDYGAITRGVGQGIQLANAFSDRQQLALDRADANALRDARIAAQRAQLEIEPQLLSNNLALSNDRVARQQFTPIELAEGTSISRTPTGDIVALESVTQIDPTTGRRDLVTRQARPLALSEDLKNKEAASNAAAERLRLTEQANQARAEAQRVAADNARIQAEAAKTRAEAYGRSVDSGASRTVTPDLVFNRRNAQNLADIDEKLGLGSVEAIQQFGSTDEGRKIIDKISTARRGGLAIPLSDGDWQVINQFRASITDMANQPPVAGSAPTVAAATLPNASPVKQVLLPNDQAALDWAKANPNDPRAAAIRQRLGQ